MTTVQILAIGGAITTALLGVVGFFLRRLLTDHDKTKSAVGALDLRISELKLSIEQNFVSFDTFETMRTEFRTALKEIYQEQANQGKILARLDERSNWEQRFGEILERVAPKRRG